MGIWLADLYATYATQYLPKKCKVFIFVQYIISDTLQEQLASSLLDVFW